MLRIMLRLRSFEDDIQKHMYLSELHDRNETLFHRVVVRHIECIRTINIPRQ